MSDNKNPEMCLIYLEDTQTRNEKGSLVAEIGCVKFDETGYYATTWGLQSKEWVKWYNEERLGLRHEEWNAMQICSMFNRWSNYEGIKESIRKAVKVNETLD